MNHDLGNKREVDKLSRFLNILNAESERSLPITAGAMLDDVLEEILKAFLAENAEAGRLLNGFNAPLGTFSARISACYALALIDEEEFQELKIIKKIRNRFAHGWRPKEFEENAIADLCKTLPWRGPGEHEHDATSRNRFSMAVSMLLVDFMWRVRLVIEDRRVVKPWPNRARM